MTSSNKGPADWPPTPADPMQIRVSSRGVEPAPLVVLCVEQTYYGVLEARIKTERIFGSQSSTPLTTGQKSLQSPPVQPQEPRCHRNVVPGFSEHSVNMLPAHLLGRLQARRTGLPVLLRYSQYLQNLIGICRFAQKLSGTQFHCGHNRVDVTISRQHLLVSSETS